MLQGRPEAFGKPVHRLGLALSYGIDARGVHEAADAGINYLLCTQFKTGAALPAVKELLARDRERFVVAAGPTLGFTAGSVRRAFEQTCKRLGVEYLDVFQLYWLGRMSAWTPGTLDALLQLKQEGKVRRIGVSIHDRPRAGRMAAEGDVDMLMVRYNAAHPGAERDIFPHLREGRPAVVAYTATAWRKLLKAPSGWTGPVPTAADCYRFCLSNPLVDVVLAGPSNTEQLRDTLRGLGRGPMEGEEMAQMRAFGSAAHG